MHNDNGRPNTKKGSTKFGKKYCTISLYLLKSLIESYEYEQVYVPEILEGLHNLVPAMNDYFNLVPTVERQIKESELTFILYESFVLPNKER
ncbi:20893_t:CDS:1, partial [Cetraspora pellucida]